MMHERDLVDVKIISLMMVLIVMLSYSAVAKANVDEEIYDMLQEHEMLEVTVTLNDVSGVDIESATNQKERDLLIVEREKFNKNITDDLVASLLDDEFVFTPDGEISSRSFTGNITRKGLEKLENDPRILKIYVPVIHKTLLNGADDSPLELSDERQLTLLNVIVLLSIAILVGLIYFRWRKNANT